MEPYADVPTAQDAPQAVGHRCEAPWDVSLPLKYQPGAQSLMEGDGLQGPPDKNKFLLRSLIEVTPRDIQ